MKHKRSVLLSVYLILVLAAVGAAPLEAQSNCTSSAIAAVQCFVANAVATNLVAPRHNMTLAQFEAYGVAVSQILKSNHTYLMLITTSSAVADAMPPINANGTPNQSAQNAVLTAIVSSEYSNGFVNAPQGVTLLDLQWFAEDVAAAMNDNQGYMQLLTPGATLRLLDSYVVAATTGNTVDWPTVDASISNLVDAATSAGIIRIPPGETATQLKALMYAVAQIIYSYKTATGRKTL